MYPSIQEIEINEDLKKCGVTRFAKEGLTSLFMICKEKPIIFNIQKEGLFATLQNFKDNFKGKKIDQLTQEVIILVLSTGEYHPNILLNGNAPTADEIAARIGTPPSIEENNLQGVENDNSIAQDKGSEYAAIAGDITLDPSKDLDPHIPDKDYAEYVIRTAKKIVKQEDALVRQIVYVGLTKDSLAVLAPTSEGKTHAVLQTLQYFPKQDLWKIGSMSPKVIIRQSGILVDSNNEPLEEKIKELKKQIREAHKNKNEDQEEELKEHLRHLYQEAKVIVDLTGKLLVFLEPPHQDTWSILKPILSHDDYEIEHPYVYEVEGTGFRVKKVVTRGWPACIFCSAKNESKWPVWPEIQSRFLITSPNMSSQKYLEGNILTATKMGLPRLAQQSLIISDRQIELAKKCILYLIQKIKDFTACVNNGSSSEPVWIPYSQILANVLPAEKGTDNRITKRIFSFLRIITLSRAHLRGRLQYGAENLVIADLEDLHEVLHITQNVSGIPTYKLKLFKEVFLEKYKSKTSPDVSNDGKKEERIIAVTTRELCDYYKEKTGKAITSNNLKQNYLNEFINNGLIDEEDSLVDNRQKIYRPIVDIPEDEDVCNDQHEKISLLSISDRMDNILQHPRLIVPKRFKYIPENWLELDILDLLKYPSIISRFELYNHRNERLCICRFIDNYQKSQKINGYFSNGIFYNTSSNIFGFLQNLDHSSPNWYKKLSIEGKVDNKDIFFVTSNGEELRGVTNNIAYAQVIRNNHLYRSYADHNKISEGRCLTPSDHLEPIQPVEDFFYNDPNLPWQPLPEHSLQESPCYPIIGRKGEFYYCRIHQDIQNIYLESIEHHCKYKEHEKHKAEILRLMRSGDN